MALDVRLEEFIGAVVGFLVGWVLGKLDAAYHALKKEGKL